MKTCMELWSEMLISAGNLLIEESEELNRIDAIIGDGDHGITMKKIANLMISHAKIGYQGSEELFSNLGLEILSTPGGSACLLYGTFFSGFLCEEEGVNDDKEDKNADDNNDKDKDIDNNNNADDVDNKDVDDKDDKYSDNDDDFNSIKALIINGYEELTGITNAKAGEKTMMDALIPAVETLRTTDAAPAAVMRKAAESAKTGAESTKGYIAKYGRAKNYKEKSLGVPDPGAMSVSIVFEGFAKALEFWN